METRTVSSPSDRLAPESGPVAVVRLARPPKRKIEGLSQLLERRADLRGTYAPADYMEEAIRWSA